MIKGCCLLVITALILTGDIKMKELIGKVVFVELFGEGYYSGSCCSQSGFFTKEFFEENEDLIRGYTPYFHYLDGKHSEVDGDVKINMCETVEDLISAFKTYTEMDDDYMIWESMLDGVSDVQEQNEFSNSITSKIKTNTVVTITYDGQEI